ncbi:hypothetical protein [Bacillus sp. 3255]|uniref:hypothetical protein n=1 Tax=Bacillus sp. 3255 TaxID=2817904 RepID=UPI00285BC430|nr:hypothetical protein [Bacillus sp. 3255]MDR6878594.1 hypothetical protein [Bacillus sp. 3255]
MGRSDDFLSLNYARRLFLQGIQLVHRPKTTFFIRQQTGETPLYLADAICPEAGRGTLAVTNHYIVFLDGNKKTVKLFPLLSVAAWGVDTDGQAPFFWLEGIFEQGKGSSSTHKWYTASHKDMLETVTAHMEQGAVAKKRAALARSREKLDTYMAVVNTILNQQSEVILLEGKAALDDQADTLLQNTQVMLDALWEYFLTLTLAQLLGIQDDVVGKLKDQVMCYAALKGNRIAKIVLEARGYALPAADVFIDSDAFIDEYYQAVLPPFEILEKVHEDVLALSGKLLPEFGRHADSLRFLVSEAVQLGYRVTIANAMVVVKMSRRIA